MKKIIFLVLSFLLLLVNSEDFDQNKFPLCKICGCKYDANDTIVDVTCNQPIKYNMFQDFFWKINGTNDTANYFSLAIHNNEFINFTQPFPNSNLTILDLADNAIYNISDSIFRNLQNMKILILSNNDLEILHPDTFKGFYLEGRLYPLRSLKELRLDRNRLHTLDKDIFEHTTDMEILDLSHNPLEVIDIHTLLAIDSLPSLKELYLQYTGIKTLPNNMFHTIRNVQILDLSGNLHLDKIPETLIQARNLQYLYLNNTGFVNLTANNGFPDMPSVRVLHLCRNEHLHHIGRFAFGGLTNLTDLRLSDNIDLVSIDELALPKPTNVSGGAIWPPIKKLYIGNNKLAYIEGDIVARWDSLSELDIRENPWTCECENQWLIDDLLPIYLKINEEMAKQVMCAAPVEMQTYSFYDLYSKKTHMRCLDTYGHQPERDGTLLVGILAGNKDDEESDFDRKVEYSEFYKDFEKVNGNKTLCIGKLGGILVSIPLILFILYAYQRRWFSVLGMFDSSPASYSRRFYKSTPDEEI